MATLAAQIETDYRILVAEKTVIDLSNNRDPDTAEDTTRTARACAHVAAFIQSKLGASVDGDDTAAVELGVRMVTLRLSSSHSLAMSDAGREDIATLKDELSELQIIRGVENAEPVNGDTDFTDLDSRYPAITWEEE